jgi:hypothetical protein
MGVTKAKIIIFVIKLTYYRLATNHPAASSSHTNTRPIP